MNEHDYIQTELRELAIKNEELNMIAEAMRGKMRMMEEEHKQALEMERENFRAEMEMMEMMQERLRMVDERASKTETMFRAERTEMERVFQAERMEMQERFRRLASQ